MAYSKHDNYIIVNYHYVENPSQEFSGIYPCSVKDFEKQVHFLNEHYKIVSVPTVVEAARSEKKDKFCAITFDDGLKNQYQNALPILEKYNAIATFFPITSVFGGRLPVAHKTHILLSQMSAPKMAEALHSFMDEFYPDLAERYRIPKDRRLSSRRLHEELITANVKETLILLPEDIKAQFLRFCFKQAHLDEEKIAGKLFLSKEEVADLVRRGMTIGNHSHSHYTFDIIGRAVMENELQLSQQALIAVIGKKPEVFSYPHGRNSSAAIEVLVSEGFKYALTIDRRGVSSADNNFLLPRYDTTDIV